MNTRQALKILAFPCPDPSRKPSEQTPYSDAQHGAASKRLRKALRRAPAGKAPQWQVGPRARRMARDVISRPVTDAEIRAYAAEALTQDGEAVARLCGKALAGDKGARAHVERMVLAARQRAETAGSMREVTPLVQATIETVASRCAELHRRDGWNLLPEAYVAARFPEDEAALRAAIGALPSGLEVIRFEQAVRARLPAPVLVRWNEVELFSAEDLWTGPSSYDRPAVKPGYTGDRADVLRLLREYRAAESIRGAFLVDPDAYEEGEDPSLVCIAGPKVSEIDWTGIDSADPAAD